MRSLPVIVVIVVAALWMEGCAQSVRQVDALAETGTTGVFTEVADGFIQPGKVDVVVTLSIKTHLANHYLLESGKSLHGKPGYPFVLSIDDQTVIWREDGSAETTAAYDPNGLRTPEGGSGRRYVLEKRLRMAPGRHRVAVGLPEEPVVCAFDLTIGERDKPYVLELRPTYRRSGKERPSFLYGVSRLWPYLDSIPLCQKKC